MSKGIRRPSKTPRSNEFVIPIKVEKKEDYPQKDIGFLVFMISHDIRREPILERIWEYVTGEESLITKLEKYGQDSDFWKNKESTAAA